jgi:Prp8 binding protein
MEDEQQGGDGPPLKKRQRGYHDDDDDAGDARATVVQMVPYNNQEDNEENTTHRRMNHDSRTSSLSSPTLSLTGHSGSVYALEYSPDQHVDGNSTALLSASFDKTVLLWSHPDYGNYNVLRGHKNAVLDAHWVDADTVVTCSADQTVMLWDALTGQRLRKFVGHSAIVNACTKLHNTSNNSVECNLMASVSDDGTCRLWDRRQKPGIATLLQGGGGGGSGDGGSSVNLPILAVAGTDQQLFTAGIDNRVTCWDLKTNRKQYAMTGHSDTITSLALHPSVHGTGGSSGELTYLLSNGMDHTLKMWDVRPFVVDKNKRFVKQFVGHKHNAEKGLLKCAWSSSSSSSNGNNMMVTAGSADRMVHIWDEYSTDELYLLPGHKGCVHAVAFHPLEQNVVASGSSDNTILVGELSS